MALPTYGCAAHVIYSSASSEPRLSSTRCWLRTCHVVCSRRTARNVRYHGSQTGPDGQQCSAYVQLAPSDRGFCATCRDLEDVDVGELEQGSRAFLGFKESRFCIATAATPTERSPEHQHPRIRQPPAQPPDTAASKAMIRANLAVTSSPDSITGAGFHTNASIAAISPVLTTKYESTAQSDPRSPSGEASPDHARRRSIPRWRPATLSAR